MPITNKLRLLEHIGYCVNLSTHKELEYAQGIVDDVAAMSPVALAVLRAAFRNGPLEDGDVPSKAGRDELLEGGYIAKVIVNGEQGFNACTYKGGDALKVHKYILENSSRNEAK